MNDPKTTATKQKVLKAYKLGTAAVLALTAVLGLISFLAFFDSGARYFENSPIKIILYVILALAVLFAISAAFTSKRIGKIEIAPKAPYSLSLIPTATAIAVFAIAATETAKGDNSTLSIIIAISLLGAALYHLADVLNFSGAVRLALGYVKILFCVLIIAKLYLDFKVELNSPIKLLAQFSAATAVLSTLSDLRSLIDRASTGYFILSNICYLTASLLGAIAALTEVVCNLDKYNLDLLIYPILFFAAAIPAAVRFFTAKIATETEAPTETADQNAD